MLFTFSHRLFISLFFTLRICFLLDGDVALIIYTVKSKKKNMVKSKQFNVLFSTSKFGFYRNIVVEHVESQQLKCKGNEQWRKQFQEFMCLDADTW